MKSKYKIEEHLGEKFGLWTVIGFSHLDSKSQQFWLCKCECGIKKPVRCSHLIRKMSLGCRKCKASSLRGINSLHWKGGKFISSTMITRSKLRAKTNNIEFTITIEELEDQWEKQKGLCAYSGEKLTLHKHNRDTDFNASIDRLDSSKGYVKNNVQWVLKYINIMKSDMKESEFINLCKLVAKNN